LKLFEESVEKRIEFLDARGAVEYRVDDVAGEKAVSYGVEARNCFAFICARAGGFRRVGALARCAASLRGERAVGRFPGASVVWGVS
jgi:hypothetical protein